MNELQNEKLSALMDGELDELNLGQIARDESARATWHRYHLVSDVLHKRQLMPANLDFSAKISELIKNEPAILAPISRTRPAYLKQAAGFAVAASVAALAILGVQLYQNDIASPNQVEVAEVQPSQPVRELVVAAPQPLPQQPVSQNNATVRPVQMEIQSNAKISRYIIQHNEYQSNVGMQGVMPHVRLVTIDANNE
jgi:sigma-E factor negative regulatory protein RseA